MTDTAVSIENLHRYYGDVHALDGVSLAVGRGEIYGFLGPNGAGKTTLVRVLCTLLEPSSGTARVAGFNVVDDRSDVRLRTGVALQEVALDPRQTGVELLKLQGRLYGLSRAEIDGRLAALRDLIDIGEALDRQISTYSGGMRRRLDLGAALIHNPEVLFLDEPTAGLDPLSRRRVWDEIVRLNTELEVTIFLTTQYLDEADHLADRVGIIHEGRLVAEGTPEQLKGSIGNDVVAVRVHEAPDQIVARLLEIPGVESVERSAGELLVTAGDGASVVGPVAVALDRTGAVVRDITLRTASLDDVFFELTGGRIPGPETSTQEHSYE